MMLFCNRFVSQGRPSQQTQAPDTNKKQRPTLESVMCYVLTRQNNI